MFRALIGQQISLAAAAICAAKRADRYGEPVDSADPRLHRLLPTAEALAAVDPPNCRCPEPAGGRWSGWPAMLTDGTLDLLSEQPWRQRRAALLAVPGIGPWTADYVGLRALGETDILLDTDLVIKRELALHGIAETARWAPWRSYATMHLWQGYFDRGPAAG